MGKQYSKRRLPDLILIEGFWNIGKTTLINHVRKMNKLIYISEPNHLRGNIRKSIHGWYEKEHKRRFEVAAKDIKENKKVIMERSLISNISYQYATDGKFLSQYMSEIKKIEAMGSISVTFLYGSKSFILKQSRKIKDTRTRSFIFKKKFYNRYLEFYRKIFPKCTNMNIKIIKVDKMNHFKTSEKILSLFYRQFPLLENKCKYYTLSQKHQGASEKLKSNKKISRKLAG